MNNFWSATWKWVFIDIPNNRFLWANQIIPRLIIIVKLARVKRTNSKSLVLQSIRKKFKVILKNTNCCQLRRSLNLTCLYKRCFLYFAFLYLLSFWWRLINCDSVMPLSSLISLLLIQIKIFSLRIFKSLHTLIPIFLSWKFKILLTLSIISITLLRNWLITYYSLKLFSIK